MAICGSHNATRKYTLPTLSYESNIRQSYHRMGTI